MVLGGRSGPLVGPRTGGRDRPVLLDGKPQLASNDETLDLARPLADLEDLRIAIEAAHRRFVDEAVAAEDLRCRPGGADGRLGGMELRNGGLAPVRQPVV